MTDNFPDIAPFRDNIDPRGIITDPEMIAPWLTDWRGRYHGKAVAILEPADTGQVAAVVATAARHGIALVPQGGNTSMVGGATPPADGRAVILSLRRMNRIRAISARDNLAVCEAGLILSNLHDAAAAVGRRFPLSLGAKGSATVGGLISTNAGGTQVLRHGTMRALVAGLEAVLPDGTIYDGLSPLKKDNRGPDVKGLLIGAEGTMGVITAAVLHLVPAVADSATAWISLPDPEQALKLLRFLEGRLGPCVEGFELVADDGLGHVLRHIPGVRSPVKKRGPWHALVQVDVDTVDPNASATERLEAALADYAEAEPVLDAVLAQNKGQADGFWRIRESLSEAERAVGPAVQFDVSVPVAAMPKFIMESIAACERTFTGTSASCYGHLGDGNVHFHVRAPAGTADALAWIAERGGPISQFVHDAVVAAGGSISAEHGIGQMKRAELGRLGPPAHVAALRALKAAFDPHGIMNPEKLIPLASEGGSR